MRGGNSPSITCKSVRHTPQQLHAHQHFAGPWLRSRHIAKFQRIGFDRRRGTKNTCLHEGPPRQNQNSTHTHTTNTPSRAYPSLNSPLRTGERATLRGHNGHRACRLAARNDLGPGIKTLLARIGRTAWAVLAAVVLVFAAGFWLRGLPFTADSSLSASIDVIGAFLSFTIAANTLVRFRGTRDRMPLVLAVGFGASGLLELGATLELFRYLTTVGPLIERARMSWMQSRTLLAETMLLAIAVERRPPQQRDPDREIGSALTLVGTVGYLTSALYFIFSGQPAIRAAHADGSPLGIAACSSVRACRGGLSSAIAQGLLRPSTDALAISAWMNVACHLMMLESARMLDAPSALAQTLRVSSYAVVLGGTLLDNSRLFMQVHHLAATDPLTGLANYRRLVDVLEAEIERSGRTGRGFAVMLLDLDGLKTHQRSVRTSGRKPCAAQARGCPARAFPIDGHCSALRGR